MSFPTPSQDNAGPDTRPYFDALTCFVCGESDASVSTYNETYKPRCYACTELAELAELETAEAAAAELEDREAACTCVRAGDWEDASGCEEHSAPRRPVTRQQGELNFLGEVA